VRECDCQPEIDALEEKNRALAERVRAWEDRFAALTDARSPDMAGNAVIRLNTRVAALEAALREIVGNPHVTGKSWEAAIAAAALEGKK
jgi:hypothetical protein